MEHGEVFRSPIRWAYLAGAAVLAAITSIEIAVTGFTGSALIWIVVAANGAVFAILAFRNSVVVTPSMVFVRNYWKSYSIPRDAIIAVSFPPGAWLAVPRWGGPCASVHLSNGATLRCFALLARYNSSPVGKRLAKTLNVELLRRTA